MDVNASRFSEEGDTNVNEALHRMLIVIIMPKCLLGEDRLGIRGREKARGLSGSLGSALVDLPVTEG